MRLCAANQLTHFWASSFVSNPGGSTCMLTSLSGSTRVYRDYHMPKHKGSPRNIRLSGLEIHSCAMGLHVLGTVSRLQVQQLTQIYTNTDYYLIASCTWILSNRYLMD